MQTSLFDYDLPQSLIAQRPAEPRDSSRLLVLERATGVLSNTATFAILVTIYSTDDLLIANDSRVMPARLHGHKPTGGQVEIFLLRQVDDAGLVWDCLVRGRKLGVRVKR